MIKKNLPVDEASGGKSNNGGDEDDDTHPDSSRVWSVGILGKEGRASALLGRKRIDRS